MPSEFDYGVCGARRSPENILLTNVRVNSFGALANQEHGNSSGSVSGGNELLYFLITQPFANFV